MTGCDLAQGRYRSPCQILCVPLSFSLRVTLGAIGVKFCAPRVGFSFNRYWVMLLAVSHFDNLAVMVYFACHLHLASALVETRPAPAIVNGSAAICHVRLPRTSTKLTARAGVDVPCVYRLTPHHHSPFAAAIMARISAKT